MKQHDFKNLLTEKDFHLDPLGRVVIDNPDILTAINGALKLDVDMPLHNGGCSNSGCK